MSQEPANLPSPSRRGSKSGSSSSSNPALSVGAVREAIVQVAETHFHQNQLAAARHSLDLLTALSAHTAETLQSLGNICLLLGEPEPARAAYSQAVELQPRNACLLVGLAATSKDDPSCFLGHLYRALALEPDHAEALRLLADFKRDAGCHQEAVTIYRRLVGTHPNQVDIYLSLAKCHFELGTWDAAMSALVHALVIDPSNRWAMRNLCFLQSKLPTACDEAAHDHVSPEDRLLPRPCQSVKCPGKGSQSRLASKRRRCRRRSRCSDPFFPPRGRNRRLDPPDNLT